MTVEMAAGAPGLSVVIPVYNEALNLPALFDALGPVLQGCTHACEIICVDDGSRDDSYEVLRRLCTLQPDLRVVKLSRNFGKEAALMAGLAEARGRQVLFMDADLQHPPAVIPDMLAAAQKGFDVVYGVRRDRRTDPLLRRFFSNRFYALFRSASSVKIPPDAGDFRLMSRRAAEALQALPEQTRFLKGLYTWIGFAQTALDYDVAPRFAGHSKWPVRKLFGYAWSGLVSFSEAPLRIWSGIGAVIAGGALLYAAWIVIITLIFGRDVPGYATLASSIFFLGGLQLLSIGILGEYLARIYTEDKRRPIYIVEERHGFDA